MLPALLINFLLIGLMSIGGGYATLPMIRQLIVEGAGWLTVQEFTDILTISQMTPGPLAVNASTFVGMRVAGLPGAIIATFGCVITGILISLLLYRILTKHSANALAGSILGTLKAASVGLIASAAMTILLQALSPPEPGASLKFTAIPLFGLGLILLRKLKLNPILLMAISGAAGIFLYGAL